MTRPSILAEAADLERRGEPFVLATVVWRRAPSSGHQGAKTIIRADGRTSGWVGGACAGPTVVREAMAALGDGRPRLLFLGPAGELDGGLRTDVVNVPMACESEGALELYLEPVLPQPQVIVIGGSPAVATLFELASALGWRAEAIDDSDLGGMAIDGRTAVVVATQGHYDEDALEAALATAAGYVGLVASAARAPAVLAELEARGLGAEARERVRAPAGLDLGRIDHAEIAVAVLAELVALKAAGGLDSPADLAVQAVAQAQATDPVCGMAVDVDGARHVLDHAGARWYFCSAGCLRTFRADPDKFAEGGPGVR